MEKRTIQFSIESKKSNVPLVGVSIHTICGLLELPDIECSNVELGVVEVLSNIIKYAYNNEKGNIITVEVSIDDSRIEISVSDSGVGIPEEKIKKVQDNPDSMPTLDEGGRGLYIINTIMDSVEIEHHENRNIWKLVKNF
jgi:anti-sigma regulatory factor (Ser/Thr protein kinase)